MLKKIRSTATPSACSELPLKTQVSLTSFHKKGQDLDLTELFQPPEQCGYSIDCQSSLGQMSPLLEKKKEAGFEVIESNDVTCELTKVKFELKKRGARFVMPLSEMYKYISYEAYESKFVDYLSAGEDRRVLILDISTKEIDPDAPIILYCHGSHKDLGSLTHYFADFVSQMKAQIVAFELPGFGPQEPSNTPLKLTQSLIMTYAGIAFDYAKGLTKGTRKIFVYGQGSGAIPAVELAKLYSDKVSGLILEDAIIEFKKKKGLIFKKLVKEDRYLKVVGELDRVSVLLFHGTQGKQAPFSYAQGIMDKLFNGNNGKKTRSVVEERKVHSEVAGKSVTRNTSILENIIGKQKKKQRFKFEGYFVECDNGEVMNLRRSTYYSVLREFITDVTMLQADNLEIFLNPFQAAPLQKLRQVNNKSEESSPLNSSKSLLKYYKTLQQDSGLFSVSLGRLQSCEEQNQSKEEECPFDHAVSPTNLELSKLTEPQEPQSPNSELREKMLYQVKEILMEDKTEGNLDSQEHNISTSPGTKEGTPKAIEEQRSLLSLKRTHFPTIKREWQLKDSEQIKSFLSSQISDSGSENLTDEGGEKDEQQYGQFLTPVSLINPRKYSSHRADQTH